MAIIEAVCSSFKREILIGEHDFTTGTGDTFKIALYSVSSNLGASTTVYTTLGEVNGTGYTAGGKALVNITPVLSGSTAIVDFDDVTWSGSTITARGALIYNDTHPSKAAVMVLDFGSDKSSSAGDFTVVFPTADANNAILRIS